jgi:hypothetical protein
MIFICGMEGNVTDLLDTSVESCNTVCDNFCKLEEHCFRYTTIDLSFVHQDSSLIEFGMTAERSTSHQVLGTVLA